MTYPFARGPYLEAALLCEKVLAEQDGVKSVIRIVDRVIRQMSGPTIPMEMDPFEYELSFFVRFKSGSARGPMTLQVRMTKPSGESPSPVSSTIIFEGEDDRGVDIVMAMRIKFDQVGLYWFSVSLGEVEVTRIPLRIVYIPQITQTPPGSGGPQPS
jgi:hypothetical protein